MGIMDSGKKLVSKASNSQKGLVTNRGRKWEILNSLWIIWAFIPALNCIAFFIIGKEARNRKWILYGAANIISLSLLIILANGLEEHTPLTTTLILIYCALFYFGIYLAFKWRPEYLIRRDIVSRDRKVTASELSAKVEERQMKIDNFELAAKPDVVSSVNVEYSTPKDEEKKEYEEINANKLDINKCLEAELIDLPGISVITAKKIINYCDSNNGFNSFDEFIELMDIKPHFAIQLKDLVIVIPRDKKINNSSRKLDI